MDFRDSKGAIIEPKGDVDQQFGDRIYYNINIPKPEDIPSLPTIPDPPPDFTGREEELQELLAKIAGGSSIIGLRGIGGLGKTALAFKLAERLRESYPDGQVMVDMRGTSDNPVTPSEAMGSVIHAYQPEEKLPEGEAEVKEMYRKVLNGKRALILLDNALDDKQTLSLIPPKSCALLVTSRKSIKLPGLFRKDLDVLKPGEAVELLRRVCCSTSGPADLPEADPVWMEIARLCGYLPLALRAAGSYLANSEDVNPREYARELADERTRLEVIGEEGVELGVDASLGLSFRKLQAAAQKTFLDLSVFPADFDAQAEEQICLDQGHKGLSEILRWSLVDYKAQGPDYGRYKLHDLARIFALARQRQEKKAAVSQRHASYYKDLLSAANDLYLKGGDSILAGLALFDREEANILAGEIWAAKSMEKDPAAAEICMRYPDAGVYVLDLRLHPRQKIAWLEIGLEAARRLKDRSMEGVHLGNLGNVYADLGEPRKAIEHYEQALAIDREIGDRRGEGADLGNLGNVYADLGEPRKAIEYYEQALAIAREIGDRRGEGKRLGNLGLAYAALGEPRKAIEYYEKRIAIAREIGDRRGEGNALGNLGNVYAALGEPRKAIDYYEQALAIAREIGDRRNEGAWLGSLGIAYATLSEPRKAIEFYEQALAIDREIGDRRGEGADLGNLGNVYADLGEPRRAIEYYEQQLKITQEIEDQSGEAIASWNLGLEYEKEGDLQRAAEMMQICVDFEREIGHPDAEKYADYLESLKAKLRKQ